ncbi:MAG: serine/threonine protein kinase, partial [Gammaproteobacteria bacterium]|nr:serine/threonine protein kinase [Gammaproteobacteria bacterium]
MSGYHKNALPIEHEIAEYQIKSILGHGGFGITYLAKDTSLGAAVAIKEYLPHQLATRNGSNSQIVPKLETKGALKDFQWGLKRFLQEARALAKFKHPNIVRVLRYLEANGTAYMVMEYEKGKSLNQYLKEAGGKLTEKKLMNIFLPLLTGLQEVHQAGLLHLDIKPGNIYMREDGTPMLIDFGSARQAVSQHSAEKKVVLTPGYAPIEQYPDKGEPGPWTDIYAIGASMYRCIRGSRPANSVERYHMIVKTQTDPVTPAVVVGKGNYREQLLECVDWALKAHAKDRPQTAKSLQDAMLGTANLVKKQEVLPVRTKNKPGARVPSTKTKYRKRSSGISTVISAFVKLVIILFVLGGL